MLKLILPYLSKQSKGLTVLIISSIFSNLLMLATPLLTGAFIDNLVKGATISDITNFCWLYISMFFLRLVLNYLSSISQVKSLSKIVYNFTKDVVGKYQTSKIHTRNKYDIGYVSQVIYSESNTVVSFVISSFISLLLNGINLAVPIYLMLQFQNNLTYILGILILLNIALYIVFRNKLFVVNKQLKESQSMFFAKLLEQLKLTDFINQHVIFKEYQLKVDSVFENYYSSLIRNQKFTVAFNSIEGVISTASQILVFYLGGIAIIDGNLTIGVFTIFSSYFNTLLSSTKFFLSFGKQYQEAKVSFERIIEISSFEKQLYGSSKINNIENMILKSISYKYGERVILKDLSYEFIKGKTYAIVGENGSGKTTLLNILTGLILLEEKSTFTINNIDSSDIDFFHFRKSNVSYLEQNPLIFQGSVFENIVLSDNEHPGHDKAKLLDLLYLFCEKNTLTSDYLSFKISQNQLSGGEVQKIGIVRLLLKDSSVLIMDEPTSAMDNISKDVFLNLIEKEKSDKIIIIVTHDYELAQNCDAVLDLSKYVNQINEFECQGEPRKLHYG